MRDHFLRIDPISAFLDRRDEISEKIQPEDAATASSGGTVIDSSEIDASVQAHTVVPAGKFRDKQGRWPTSSYLPGYNSSVASRVCPKCGFEAFAWADQCRCGTKFTD